MCEIFNEIRKEGFEKVRKVGEKSGEKRGEKRGEEKGVKRFSALLKKLTPGSEEYMFALNADKKQREALYAIYGIA